MESSDALSRLGDLARQTASVPRELTPPDVPENVLRATKVYGSGVRLLIIRALLDGPKTQQHLVGELSLAYSTFRKNIQELIAAGAVTVVDPDRSGRQPIVYALDLEETRKLGDALIRWATTHLPAPDTGCPLSTRHSDPA